MWTTASRCPTPRPMWSPGPALRHGGIFVFPVVDHAVLYCVALAVGSVLGAVILSLLKKNRTDAG